jgi:chloride channel protein, CIC family
MIKRLEGMLKQFLVWRQAHISNKNFLLICSVVVGFSSGMMAVFLKRLVHLVQSILHYFSAGHYYPVFLFLFPLAGIVLTVTYVKLFHKGALG